jgi:hypothetical protein
MTDVQVSYPAQAIVLYQSLLLMKCPAVTQQNVLHFSAQEQQLLLRLTEQLRALGPENSCLFLLSKLHKERQENSNKKREQQILELQCLRQIELLESNRSYQELTLDVQKEEKLHREADRKFRELETKNVSKVNFCDIHLNNQLPPLTRDPY